MFLMFKFSYCSLLFFSEKQTQTQNKKNGMYLKKNILERLVDSFICVSILSEVSYVVPDI